MPQHGGDRCRRHEHVKQHVVKLPRQPHPGAGGLDLSQAIGAVLRQPIERLLWAQPLVLRLEPGQYLFCRLGMMRERWR